MNAFTKKENIKLGPQGAIPFVTEEKPAWRQEQQRTFGKALGVAEHMATMKGKYITSEWYPFYQVYVHESEMTVPIPLLSTASGAPLATTEGAELLGSLRTSSLWLVDVVIFDGAEEHARLKFAR